MPVREEARWERRESNREESCGFVVGGMTRFDSNGGDGIDQEYGRDVVMRPDVTESPDDKIRRCIRKRIPMSEITGTRLLTDEMTDGRDY
jgi:hypothetical protein